MSYYLGIDGGGSNIRAALINEKSELVEHVKMQQNVNLTSRGSDDVFRLFEELRETLSKYVDDIEGIFVSLAGAATVQQINLVEKNLMKIFASARKVTVLPDAYGALIGNLKAEAGMLVICGTGSVVIGKEKGLILDFGNRGFYRAGGWGYLLGDEGSGFWIVKRVFQEYLKYVDGIGAYDPCFELFEQKFSKIPRESVAHFYDPEKRRAVAALSKDLLAMDNMLVWDIIRAGAWEFYKKVRSLKRSIESPANKLFYMGGMFENEQYRNLFINFNEGGFVLEKGLEELEFELAKIALEYFI